MIITIVALVTVATTLTQAPPPPPPPAALSLGASQYSVIKQGSITGAINYRTADSVVVERWRYGATVKPSDTLSIKYVEFATAYWPTDVCALSDGQILVSGKSKRASGETIIELWEFENGGAVPPPQAIQNPTTGQTNYHWLFPARTSIREVYREATVGRNMVLNVFPNHGHSGCVFVEFYDSRDIYELNLQTEAYTRVVSTATEQGVLVQPLLQSAYDCYWSADHPTRGYMYVLRQNLDLGTAPPPGLVLQDTNRDGVLDCTYTMSDLDWKNAGLGDHTAYTTTFHN